MTWRERIAAARERGYFARADELEYMNRATCLAAEVARNLSISGVDERAAAHARCLKPDVYDPLWAWSALWVLGDEANVQAEVEDARLAPSFDEVDQLLDRIEDEALRIKRELA